MSYFGFWSISHHNIWLVVWNIFYFPYIGDNHANWLIFFRGDQITNQMCAIHDHHLIWMISHSPTGLSSAGKGVALWGVSRHGAGGRGAMNGEPPGRWMDDFMEHPMKMDENWGYPYFRKPRCSDVLIGRHWDYVRLQWDYNEIVWDEKSLKWCSDYDDSEILGSMILFHASSQQDGSISSFQ